MAKSKLVAANEKIAENVVSGYKKIEDGVVGGYKKIENGVVNGFQKISDGFVDQFLTHEGKNDKNTNNSLTLLCYDNLVRRRKGKKNLSCNSDGTAPVEEEKAICSKFW